MALPDRAYAAGAIVVGFFLSTAESKVYWEKVQAQHWIEVDAEVVSTSICTWRMNRGGLVYVPRIIYRYAVGNERYRSDSVFFGPADGNQADAEKTVQRFSEGKHMVAYVDPNDRRSAVLDRDHVTRRVRAKLVFGIGLLTYGVIHLVAIRRRDRDPTRWL